MSKDTKWEHNPGSPEAVKRGCTCAVWDNNHGIGFCYGGEERCFYVTQDCHLHGFPEKVENMGKKNGKSDDSQSNESEA